jgi:hypothetical protein
MARRQPVRLEGGYIVLIKNRLQANEETDPAKWALWKVIWDCSSFEELARRAPDPVNTTKSGRRITWRTEARWALKQGWIVKATAASPTRT